MDEVTADTRAAREDAVAARHLVAANDRGVAEIRIELRDFRQATTANFDAVRDNVGGLRSDMTSLHTHVDAGFTEMRGKFDGIAAQIDHITALVMTLVERRSRSDVGNTPS